MSHSDTNSITLCPVFNQLYLAVHLCVTLVRTESVLSLYQISVVMLRKGLLLVMPTETWSIYIYCVCVWGGGGVGHGGTVIC